MLEVFDWLPQEAAGWLAVIAGLSVVAAWLALLDRRRRAQDAARVEQATPAPQPAHDRHEARAALDVARATEIAAMQAKAAQQIDAIEHSFNRLLAQCAPFIGHHSAHPLEPIRAPAAAGVPRRSLAA